MSTTEKILRSVKLTGIIPDSAEDNSSEVMRNHQYLRQSSALITEALQKGFDVLQLANGDIVTTGTKIVVTTYSWDEQRGKLVKSKSATAGRRGRPRKKDMIDVDADDDDEDDLMA